jgi:hypothetical protein
MELEGLKIVHALPGRVRLKVAKVKGNPAMARRAQEKLAKVPGIKQVEAKADTGSLLVFYDLAGLFSEEALGTLSVTLEELFPEIEAATLMAGLMSLTENPGPSANSAVAQGITESFGAINTGIRKFTGGLDLKVLVPLALVFLGLRTLWTSQKITSPSWSNLLWFGFATFVMLNRGLVEGDGGLPAGKASPDQGSKTGFTEGS